MGLQRSQELTRKYKQNIYHIELDVSGYDKVTFQVIAPLASAIYVYGTLNDGMSRGSLYPPNNNYNAKNALDWSLIQATNLATGSAVSSIASAGLYTVTVNTPYIKLGGGGDVYGLWQSDMKVS